MKPRLLLFGHTGQIGFEVARLLDATHDIIAPPRDAVDLSLPGSLRAAVREARPSLIINAAAYTQVDQAERDADLARTINAVAPAVLAEEATRANAQLVHYSTDYVFDGTLRRPYLESDAPAPLSVYGRTKLEGDHAIEASGARYVILRSGWVYGSRGRNFLLTMRRLFTEKDEVRVVDDQTGTPTSAAQLAAATEALIAASAQGLYHVAAAGQATWHGFASKILELDHRPEVRTRKVVPISTAEYPVAARRPAYSVLSCERLRQATGHTPGDWESELERIMSPRN